LKSQSVVIEEEEAIQCKKMQVQGESSVAYVHGHSNRIGYQAYPCAMYERLERERNRGAGGREEIKLTRVYVVYELNTTNE
jgi:hypothetical protein